MNASLTRTTSSVFTSPNTGTLSKAPCTFRTASANGFVTHLACLASVTDRRGMGHELTDASVIILMSPLLIKPLHVRQRARPDGARLIANLLSPAFMFSLL